jgi:hypothetical protein
VMLFDDDLGGRSFDFGCGECVCERNVDGRDGKRGEGV